MENFQHNHDGEMTTSGKINLELTNITDWLALNKLSLNENKTKVMIFHSKQRKIKQHEIPKIVINHKPVEVISQFKFLEIIMDSNLARTPHLNSLAVKLSRVCGILARLKHYIPLNILKIIYISLFSSNLSYGLHHGAIK